MRHLNLRTKALAALCAWAAAGCGGSSSNKTPADGGVNADAPGAGGAVNQGGNAGIAGNTGIGGNQGTAGTLGGGGRVGTGGGNTSFGGGGGTLGGGGIVGGGGTAGGGGNSASAACAATAQAECDLQKRCSPVKFALEWDGDDVTRFCVPHTAAACQAGVATRLHGGISAECETWLKADCSNYLSYYYPTFDSNGKRVNFNAACEVTLSHGTKTMDQACVVDFQCAAGLFCKFDADEPGAPVSSDRTCGRCRPALAYTQAQLVTRVGLYSRDLVGGAYCNRDSQCQTGYGCVLPFDVTDSSSQQVLESIDTDRHCMLLMKRGANALCVKGSNYECDAAANLICPAGAPTTDPATSPKCAAAPPATIKTYLEAGIACTTTDECNPQKYLTCVADATGTKRCTSAKVAAIGAPCSAAISCSQYARCNNNNVCEERRKSGDACDDMPAVASSYCYPAAFGNEQALVCRTAVGQIMPRCQPPEGVPICQ